MAKSIEETLFLIESELIDKDPEYAKALLKEANIDIESLQKRVKELQEKVKE